MGRPIQITALALASILVGLGLGPVIALGVSDLLGMAVTSISVANALIPILVAAIFALGFIWTKDRRPVWLNWLQHPKFNWIVVGSIALACAALIVATIDSRNTAAWRSAAQLAGGSGVNKTQLREFGREFARLSVPGDFSTNESLGTAPVDWRVWLAGGQVDVLLRSHASPENICDASHVVNIAATDRVNVLSDASTPVQGVCGQWQLVQLDLPQGATELQFGVDRVGTNAETEIDIMLANIRPQFSWFWTLCTVLAVGLVLAIVVLLSINLRGETHQAPDAGPRFIAGAGKRGFVTAGVVLLFVLASNAFVHWYVAQENTIYTWDYSGYWTSSRNVADFLRDGERKSVTNQSITPRNSDGGQNSHEPESTMPDPGAAAALIRNIRFTEYNVSTSLPVSPVMVAFGDSRMVYELSLLNIYALVALIILMMSVRACVQNDTSDWPDWWPVLPVIVLICSVPFWVPILRGYMGVSVAAPNLAVLWLYFRQPAREIGTASLLVIGLLLLAGVILQRWNAYWVVGFFLMAVADSVASLIKRRRFNALEFLQAFRAPIVSGFTALFLFIVVAWPKAVRTVTTDYADLYSAFQEDNGIASALVRQIDAFGAGIWALTLVSFVFLTIRPRTRRVAALIGLQILTVFLHFSSTQTMGPHQYFLLLPGFLIILSLGLATAISSSTRPLAIAGASAATLVLAFGVASGNAVFVLTDNSGYLQRSRLLSQSYRPPLINNDLEEFKRLALYVDELMASAPEEQGIYVLSGSATLNANHFKTLTASTGAVFNSVERVFGSSVIDKRDGFPRRIFDAHIVISSDPIQLMSQRTADQQVVRIPAERLFDSAGIGAAFERLPRSFQLDGEVSAVVFRRTRKNTVEEIDELSGSLKRFYPDRPEVYQ